MKYQVKHFQNVMLLKLLRLQKCRNQEGGFVLVVVILMILILVSLLASYTLLSKTENSSVTASSKSNTGFYAAEAGLNLRAKQIQDDFVGFNRPQGTSPDSWENCLNNTGNQGTGDFACNSQIFNNQNLLTFVQEDPNNPNSITISAGEPFAGLSAQEYRYDVNSVGVNSQNLPTAMLGMRFKSRLVPLFQFLMFYQNDLDFSIPPTINLNGAIHTNSNLYIDAASSNTLTLNGLVSTVGNLYRGAKNTNSCNGTVKIYDPASARTLSCGSGRTNYTQSNVSAWNNRIRVGVSSLTVPQPDELDPVPGKVNWDRADLRVVLKLNSSGNPSAIEVRNQDGSVNTTASTNLLNSCPTTPSTTLTSNASATDTTLRVASTSGFNIDDVIIIGTDYDSNVITAVNSTLNTITLKRQLGIGATSGATVHKIVVSTSNTFYNYREKNGGTTGNDGTYIRMLNVNIQGLLNCAYSQNLMGKALNDNSEGGLVWFLTVDGLNSTTDVTKSTIPNTPNNYAVRIFNGKYLYSNQSGAPEIQGLTIVSDQAVYIQGDYNLKADDPTTSVTERWRPAAILADTINILSNAWKIDDSNGKAYVGGLPSTTIDYDSRNATATSVNAAFLSGTEITGGVNGTAGHGGVNSGGVNNYPRFHEDWAGIPFNYKGSFVSLNRPRRTNSPFCGSYLPTTCNIYTPPIRNWDYDTDFNNAANLPPLTPRAVYLRQEVFSRDFNR